MNIFKKVIIIMSMILILLAFKFYNVDAYSTDNIQYEYINTKNIAKSLVSKKKDVLNTSLLANNVSYSISNIKEEKIEEVELPSIYKYEVPKIIWRLPTEVGTITQYPSYYHTAYDITSPRGYNEAVYPVYDGVISNIYYDYAGALIVMITHNENGIKYTSQYVHLSRFADGLYVGKNVTTNDIIGYMGASGIATGVHLHITVVDCALYEDNCHDLNEFYNYSRKRLNDGYYGLSYHVNIPYSWNSR